MTTTEIRDPAREVLNQAPPLQPASLFELDLALTEVLRRLEKSRGLQYYAGWARESKPEEFPLAASAARSAAGHALDFGARSTINVHGGIGATWEHDAPLFFRRAQLSRRLLGGTHDATDRVAEETLRTAGAA